MDSERIYTDHGPSGRTRARPSLDQALAAVRAGVEREPPGHPTGAGTSYLDWLTLVRIDVERLDTTTFDVVDC